MSTASVQARRDRRLPDLVLASRSPRRLRLLEAHGFAPLVRPARIDDALVPLAADVGPVVAATALAWLKARDVLTQGDLPAGTWVLAADTICELDGRLLGKPRDRGHAGRMLEMLFDREHRTVTGVCLVRVGEVRPPTRRLWAEAAEVAMDRPSEALVRSHLDSGAWQGKAGGYSLDEVRRAGWSIRCDGDPQVVLGLPVESVLRELAHAERGGTA